MNKEKKKVLALYALYGAGLVIKGKKPWKAALLMAAAGGESVYRSVKKNSQKRETSAASGKRARQGHLSIPQRVLRAGAGDAARAFLFDSGLKNPTAKEKKKRAMKQKITRAVLHKLA